MKFNHGINIGAWLSMPFKRGLIERFTIWRHAQSNQPGLREWPEADKFNDYYAKYITKEDICRIKRWGFDHIRLPVTLEENFSDFKFSLLDDVVNWCEQVGIGCVIALHLIPGHSEIGFINWFWFCKKCQETLFRTWRSLSERYASKGDFLAFDLINEPNICTPLAKLIFFEKKMWYSVITKTIDTIRHVDNKRHIIVQPYNKADVSSFGSLKALPYDNIIYSFHYYSPMLFTHQAAYWSMNSMLYKKSPEYPGYIDKPIVPFFMLTRLANEPGRHWNKDALLQTLESVADFRSRTGLPVYCGEFGTHVMVERKSRLRWYEDLIEAFSYYELPWAVWTYKNNLFGLIYETSDIAHWPEYSNDEHVDQELLSILRATPKNAS